jgi:hypothetical protein
VDDGPLHPLPPDSIDTFPPTSLYFKSTDHSQISGGFGATLFNVFNFGAKAHRDQNFEVEYKSEAMTTTRFDPPADYVEKSVMRDTVQTFLRSNRKSLYMIVAVRILHGAKITILRGKAMGGGPAVGPIGLSAIGSPVDANLGFEMSSDELRTEKMSIDHDFVVAYRLRQCRYSRDSGSIKPFYHVKGATMSDLGSERLASENKNVVAEGDEESIPVINSLGISSIDVNDKSMKLGRECVRNVEDEGGYSCIIVDAARLEKL